MCAHGNMLKMLHALNIPHYSAKKKKKKSNSCLRKCRPHLKRLAASNEEAAIER